jgi:ATP-dependent Lhr-like helicase
MEEAGRIRRGYFVEGLGAAQFAMPGAVDRLRAERAPAADGPLVLVLSAADPANPYGATLAWPAAKRLQRVSGAYLVLVDGEPTVYLERGHKGLVTLPNFEQAATHTLGALRRLAEESPRRELVIDRVDGEAVLSSPIRPLLEQSGFRREYLGMAIRLPPLAHPRARSA